MNLSPSVSQRLHKRGIKEFAIARSIIVQNANELESFLPNSTSDKIPLCQYVRMEIS